MTEQEVRLEMGQLMIRELDHRATICDLEAKIARIQLDKKRLEAKFVGQQVNAMKLAEKAAAEQAEKEKEAGPKLEIVK